MIGLTGWSADGKLWLGAKDEDIHNVAQLFSSLHLGKPLPCLRLHNCQLYSSAAWR